MKFTKESRAVFVLAGALMVWIVLFWIVAREQMRDVLLSQPAITDTFTPTPRVPKHTISVIQPEVTVSVVPPVAPVSQQTTTEAPRAMTEIAHGPTDQQWVALTFDAELDPTAARQNLLTLRQKDVRATIFVSGDWAKRYPEIISIAARDGHEFGNHAYSHLNFTTLNDGWVQSELQGTESIVYDLTGKTTKPLFRFPFGERLEHQVAVVNQAGYTIIKWNVDPYDWRDTAEDVLSRTVTDVPNGAIIVLHLGSPVTAQVLAQMIDELRSQGFALVTVGEMIEEMEG